MDRRGIYGGGVTRERGQLLLLKTKGRRFIKDLSEDFPNTLGSQRLIFVPSEMLSELIQLCLLEFLQHSISIEILPLVVRLIKNIERSHSSTVGLARGLVDSACLGLVERLVLVSVVGLA